MINSLLSTVSKYYSVQPDLSNRDHEGYEQLTKIIGDKINKLISSELQAEMLPFLSAVQLAFPDYQVNVELHKQFPNYSISLVTGTSDFDYLQVKTSLNLRMSLLTNLFTIFFEERVFHYNSSALMTQFVPNESIVLSSSYRSDLDKQASLEILSDIVSNFFPSYERIYHMILFSNTVAVGTPHGLENPYHIHYPIYSFLFDNEYRDMKNVMVGY
jgi:hypothetical protein